MQLLYHFSGQIDRATSQLPDWKYPVQIWIDQSKMELGFGILNPAVVIARLKSGKLHGPAVMHGLLSYDPNCHFCSKLIYPGLGFFGRFIDGKASGICWKELRGGGWIYGEMDSEGTWTGTYDVTYTVTLLTVLIDTCLM